MSNKNLFAPQGIRNEAGGVAYKGTPKQALAQLAATSCLNNTLYVSAEKQLDQILSFANKVEPEFLAKCAIYAREKHNMRDMPALLCAILTANKQTNLLKTVFPRIIDNGDILRNYFEMIRGGTVGRRSFGTVPKRLIVDWFNSRTPTELFEMSVGTPSMRDILRCIRPRPLDRTRSSMYAWFVGKKFDYSLLPEKVRHYEDWKAGTSTELPAIPFQMLTSGTLKTDILNVGGFGDAVFELVNSFATGQMDPDHIVGIIESIDLEGASLNDVKIED
jgi:60 kDa SS-A/Ro ribonucleoprotein